MTRTAQIVAVAMCVGASHAYAPSFMGQGLSLRSPRSSAVPSISMKIDLAPLPYSYTALEPKISQRTLEVSVCLHAFVRRPQACVVILHA
jgi:hypothetical protein